MPRPCNVQDCEKLSWSSGLCGTHYRQFQRGARDHDGNLLREIRAKLPNGAQKPACKIEGCEEEAYALGLCATHKSQHWLGIIDREGNALREMKRAPNQTYRTVTPKGYVRIYLPEHHRADMNGYTWEHIVIMEQKLGRLLLARELVHHRDGVRANNDPPNLELRTTATHEPGHTWDVALAVETLEMAEDPWDRNILGLILVGEGIILPETLPDPLGGLLPTLRTVAQVGRTSDRQKCAHAGCENAGRQGSGLCAGHYRQAWHRARSGKEPRNTGILVDENGYVLVWLPRHSEAMSHGYVLAHRAVMSNFLERPLADGEVVHHRNGNRADNRIENLQLLANRKLDARGYVRSPLEALRILTVTYPACLDYEDRLRLLAA